MMLIPGTHGNLHDGREADSKQTGANKLGQKTIVTRGTDILVDQKRHRNGTGDHRERDLWHKMINIGISDEYIYNISALVSLWMFLWMSLRLITLVYRIYININRLIHKH